MRVFYFGSGTFSVPSLRAIAASKHDIVGIFTQPARPAGRGGRVRPTPIADAAAAINLPVIECEDVNSDQAMVQLEAARPDVICVADFGQLIGESVLEFPPHGTFNLHGSLLPQLRGAAPINWALIRGLKTTGVTTFRVVRKMDAGPIYLKQSTKVRPEETADELRDRLAELGSKVVCDTLELLASGDAPCRRQDEARVTLAPRLQKSDGRLDFAADAEALHNLIRGTWPWPGAHAVFRRSDGRCYEVTVARASIAPGEAIGYPGCLDGELFVSTGKGRLCIEQIKPAGKKLMAWRDFVNGYRANEGDVFVPSVKTE